MSAMTAEDSIGRKNESVQTLIKDQVMEILELRDGLRDVDVCPLWDDRYRVNILVGKDAVSVRIAQSYFVKVDGGGKILETDPKMVKLTS